MIFGPDEPQIHLYFHFKRPVANQDAYGHYCLLVPASREQKGTLHLPARVPGQHPLFYKSVCITVKRVVQHTFCVSSLACFV